MEQIKVTKVTNRELMLQACEATFAGNSNQSLLSIYKSEHSPSRTQLFWVECIDIPLYVSTHLLRHHVGSQPFALTHRVDRKGGGLDLPSTVQEINKLREEQSEYHSGSVSWKLVDQKIDELLDKIETKGGRNNPTNLSLLINAQSLIDMAKLRMCKQASAHTQKVFKEIRLAVGRVDPQLMYMMVPKCVYRGGICGEPKPCGYMKTTAFKGEMLQYMDYFDGKQLSYHMRDVFNL